jgi:HK97 gp10 family phage protein
MGLRVKVAIDDTAVSALAYRLAELSAKHARAALKAGVNEATQLVAADAKVRVQKRTRQLKKSIGRKVKGYRGGAVVVGLVGPRRGFRITLPDGRTVDPAKYAHLVEYGRGASRVKKKKVLADKIAGKVFGKEVAPARPKPFLRPAFDANRAKIPVVMAREMNRGLAAFAAGRPYRKRAG